MSDTAYIPPQNIEAEKAVLGGLLLDNKAIVDLPAELKPEAFYLPSHAQSFNAMLSLWDREAPIDVVSVADEARARGHDIAVSFLVELEDAGMPRSIAYHAGLIIAAFQQRQTIDRLREAFQAAQQAPERHDEIMARLYSASDSASPSGAMPIQTVMVESLKRIDKAGEYRALIPTGLTDLDNAIGGIERAELIIDAGRPGMGKTSLALDFGSNAAARGYAVLIVSIETSREKLGLRMLSRATGINSRKVSHRRPGRSRLSTLGRCQRKA